MRSLGGENSPAVILGWLACLVVRSAGCRRAFSATRKLFLPLQAVRITDEFPQRYAQPLCDGIRDVQRRVALKPFNEGNHLGRQIRLFSQLFLGQAGGFAVLSDHLAKTTGGIF